MRLMAATVLSLSLILNLGCKEDPQEAARRQQQFADAEAAKAKAEQLARYRSAIEKVLQMDLLTGTHATSEHTQGMRSIDLSECPLDFRVAYMAHIHAWDEAAAVMAANDKLNSNEDSDAIAGGLATLFSSDATPWQDHLNAKANIERLAAQADADIKSTFNQVEILAAAYGARVPHS